MGSHNNQPRTEAQVLEDKRQEHLQVAGKKNPARPTATPTEADQERG